ncbi:MAG: potassium-transporting ATPase subunit KdpA [Nevskiaceae bacterium]|nr:potassium-transporting ATPase subunit KdpA [Nevskiaceae bacterium]
MNGFTLAALQLAVLVLIIALLYRPLGDYMARVYTAATHLRIERLLYKIIGADPDEQQSWRVYLRALLLFTLAGFAVLYGLQRLQQWLPYSLGLPALPPDLAFNTAASFVGNTNWQAFSPETTVGYAVQALGLAVQMFLSAAVSMAVAVALIRGLAARATGVIGNFWVDVTRSTLRILLPLSLIAAVIFVASGVVQNLSGFTDVTTIAGGAQSIPGGPVASQEAIKLLGTNGGGFFNANSAHPLSNPTAWANLFQTLLLILIPFCLPRTFGTMVADQRAGRVLLWAFVSIFLLVFISLTAFELAGWGSAPELAGAAMEGKEQRFGIVGSTTFGAATTGTTGGAVNSMHDSFTALGGMVLLLNMMAGEVSPGGAGAGIYAMTVYVIIAAFLVALLLGRSPVYLGKRIGPREMKLVSTFILVLPVIAICALALSFAIPAIHAEMLEAMHNAGPHGLTEVMYAFVSAAANNGSAFAGLSADTPWLNVTLGILILLGRLLPITLVLCLAGSFAQQDRTAPSSGRLPLDGMQFIVFVVVLVLFIALPMFLPYLMAGPLAEGLVR